MTYGGSGGSGASVTFWGQWVACDLWGVMLV